MLSCNNQSPMAIQLAPLVGAGLGKQALVKIAQHLTKIIRKNIPARLAARRQPIT
jgi:hypothetical protein